MDMSPRTLLVANVKLPVDASQEEAFSVALRRLRKNGISFKNAACSIFRRSVDARRRSDVQFVYSVAVTADFSDLDVGSCSDITILESAEPRVVRGSDKLSARPMVVGMGPCGLFAALLLAEQGYKPIIIDRGGNVRDRTRSRLLFNSERVLDPESNVQFGAGGAGTFSDGKLVTRINDPLSSYVLDTLVRFGASESIKYVAKPHVGTDVLTGIVDRMLAEIERLGGEVCYNTKFLNFTTNSRKIISVSTTAGDFDVGALILAVGHSARDTYSMLLSKGVSIEGKAFSVGMRIEHLAEDIDKALYGDFAGNPNLGHAEYNLANDTKNRGVYTFCMCPGGEVVAAASEEGGLVVNGMSNNARDGVNSNSAVVCSIFRDDYGSSPDKAIEFQRNIERKAFSAGKQPYFAPFITVGDFLSGNLSREPSRIKPTYMGGRSLSLERPEKYLPTFVCEAIKKALVSFDKRIPGFAASEAVLTGAETRTSAPVRILRDGSTHLALGYDNLYPAGEGAGYAGGITSAAVDGLKTAISVIARYKPIDG